MRHDRHAKELAEAGEVVSPVSGNRRFYSGFYDRAAGHGPITGSGPGFEAALAEFKERQRQNGLPGVWRNSTSWKVNKGTRRDIDYAVMEWI